MADQFDRLKSALADRYAIQRELGSGGMATVYLAEDLKHHRKVAVKVLRPELAATLGPERFLWEIEVAAQLHHPHILPLYDSGEATGFLYYVMPYESGQSLREKLVKEGELPVSEAVRVLRDVVDALAHAHAEGVVHRDIKPENIMLSGRHALVTDFGVAKAISEATGREKLTTAGVALGTPAYMAPEQAVAETHIDHRADIYAVGALAYELLAGRPPFSGTTPQMVLSAHVTEAPEPVEKHRQAVPSALRQLVMKCLEKKPADRWQSADELLQLLEALTTPSGGISPTDTRLIPAVTIRSRAIGVGLAVAAAIAVIVGVLGLWSARDRSLFRPGRQTQVTRALGLEVDPAFSPDGRTVSYAAGTAGRMRLYVRQLGGGGTIELTGTLPGNHRSPRWSPDAANLVYQSQGAIFTIPVFGGTPRQVVGANGQSGEASAAGVFVNPDWSPDGQRIAYVWHERPPNVAFQRGRSEVHVLPLSGGEPRKVTDASEAHSIRWSPDGSMLAYVSGASLFVFGTSDFGDVDPSSIWVVPASGGEPVRVTSDDDLNISPVWWPDGKHLLFVSNRDGSRDIYQVPVGRSGEPRGTPIRLTTGLNAHTIDVSADGTRLIYSVFTHLANLWSLTIPSRGTANVTDAMAVTSETQVIERADLSKDGTWFTFDSNREGNQDIYRMPISGGEPQRLTTHPGDDYFPTWSPNGREIAFYSLRTGNRDLFVMSANGGALQQLTDHSAQDRLPDWSPDGNSIAFSSDRTGRNELYVISREPGTTVWSAPEQLTTEGGSEPKWSPDGTEIVYVVRGRSVWTLSLKSRQRHFLVETEQGSPGPQFARWSEDGKTVYYIVSTGGEGHSIWSVPASGGRPQLVAEVDDPSGRLTRPWFMLHGERFYLVLRELEADVRVMELAAR